MFCGHSIYRHPVRFYITGVIILKCIKLNTLLFYECQRQELNIWTVDHVHGRIYRLNALNPYYGHVYSILPHLTSPSWATWWRPLSSQMLHFEYFSLNIVVLCPLCKAAVMHSSWLNTDDILEHLRCVSVMELSLLNLWNEVFPWLSIAKWSNMKEMKIFLGCIVTLFRKMIKYFSLGRFQSH